MKNQKEKIIELLKNVAKQYDMPDVETVAEYLLREGVIAPPLKVGDTVYAALRPVLGEEPCIEEWSIKGVAYNLKGEMLAQSFDGEWYVVGEEYCLLTREAAEQILECCIAGDKMQQTNVKGDKPCT